MNVVGLTRRGFAKGTIDALRAAYKLLCHDGLNVSDAIAAIERDVPDLPEVREVVEFFRTTKRGVIR